MGYVRNRVGWVRGQNKGLSGLTFELALLFIHLPVLSTFIITILYYTFKGHNILGLKHKKLKHKLWPWMYNVWPWLWKKRGWWEFLRDKPFLFPCCSTADPSIYKIRISVAYELLSLHQSHVYLKSLFDI